MYCSRSLSNTPMYYSHVRSNSFSRTLFMLTHLKPNAVQRNAFSFVHLRSVVVITARQTVADPCFAACMALSVWPCLYGVVCMALFVWRYMYGPVCMAALTLSCALRAHALPHLLLTHCSHLQSSHLKPFVPLEHFQAPVLQLNTCSKPQTVFARTVSYSMETPANTWF